MFKKKNKEVKITSGASLETQQEIKEYVMENGKPLFYKKLELSNGDTHYVANPLTTLYPIAFAVAMLICVPSAVLTNVIFS